MNTSKNTTGILLQAIIAGLICALQVTPSLAAQSPSYEVGTDSPTYAEHAAGTSPSYQLNGGMTWHDTAPLASTSFQIVPDPAGQGVTSSTAASSLSTAPSTPSTVSVGGHRGSSVSSSHESLHPAASSLSSRRMRSSAASQTLSSQGMSASSSLSSVAAASGSALSASSAPCASVSMDHTQAVCQMLLTTIAQGGGSFGLSDLEAAFLFGCALGLTLGVILTLFIRYCLQPATRRKKVSKNGRRLVRTVLLIALALAIASFAITYQAHAASTTPQRYIYNGHLLDSSGHPITTAHAIRFSFWKSADAVAGDHTAGAINTGSATYGGWQEVDTVTPDATGYFSVQLGAVTPLPDLSGYSAAELHALFLQVEVKAQADPDTSYELLDVDPSDPVVDRSPIASVPFAQNADFLDQREVGTGSGSIPLLGPGGTLPATAIPSALNGSSLILDSTNSATGSINLQFGTTLAKTLSYDTANHLFTFNDAVRIQGNLTVLGLINGVDVTNLGSATGALRVGSGGGLTIKIAGGSYRLAGTAVNYPGGTSGVAPNTTNYVFFGSGGLTVRTMPFPTDESFIPLAEVVTNAGAVSYILDRRQLMSDDREQLVETTLHPQYADSAYSADGTNNVGQLSVIDDPITQKTAYLWTSTRPTLQDYDVVVRLTLPAEFIGWKASPFSFFYKSSSADAATTKIDMSVTDTAGNPVTLSGSSANLANTAWTAQTVDFAGTPTWTPGGTVVVHFKLSAKNDEQMMLGDFGIRYSKLAGK